MDNDIAITETAETTESHDFRDIAVGTAAILATTYLVKKIYRRALINHVKKTLQQDIAIHLITDLEPTTPATV